jgi:type I restriction enzyme S subunit
MAGILTGCNYLDPAAVDRRWAHFRLHRGDTLLSASAALGRVAIVDEDGAGAIPYTGIIRMRPRGSQLCSEFIRYLLEGPEFQHQAEAVGIGSVMRHFGPRHLRLMSVIVPPVQTQLKIVAILSAYDKLIENNNRRIKSLEEMVRRVYDEWFVEFGYPGFEKVPTLDSAAGPIPQGWAWKELRELAVECRSGVEPDSMSPETAYVGLEHMPERSISLAEWGMAGDVGSRKYMFKQGDVLFGKIRPYFHKVVVAPIDGICSTDAIVIRSRAPEYSGLVVAVVSSDAFVQQAVQTSQGTKMPRANWAVLERYLVPVPPPQLLRRFDALIGHLVALIHRLVLSTRALGGSRALLLPRLTSGEIDVTDLDSAMPPTAA